MGLPRITSPWADWTSPFASYGQGDPQWPPCPKQAKTTKENQMAKDHKITLTIKGTGGYDHPWLVFGGDDAAEVQRLLSDAHENDLFTAAGRAHAAFLRGATLGSELEATTTKVEKTPADAPASTPAAPASTPAAPAAPAEESAAPVVAPPIPEGAPRPAWKK